MSVDEFTEPGGPKTFWFTSEAKRQLRAVIARIDATAPEPISEATAVRYAIQQLYQEQFKA